jgi:hypothetical protein
MLMEAPKSDRAFENFADRSLFWDVAFDVAAVMENA